MSLTKKVAYNTIFQIVGKVIVTAISLVSIGYLTRYLGVSSYGAYTTIFVYVSFWAVLADLGFFWVMIRELEDPAKDNSYVFNNVMTAKIVFSLFIFLLAVGVGFLIPQYDHTIKIGIAIVAISNFFITLNGTYVGLLQSRLEMYKASISEILGRSIILAVLLYMVYHHASLDMILFSYVLGNLGNFALSFVWGSKYIRLRPAFDFPYWKIILAQSIPLAILSIIGMIHFRIDSVILSLMKGTIDVGIYGVPYKILEVILIIPGIFIGNIFPILTRYYHTADERLNNSIQKSFDFLVILAFPVATALVVLASPIISFIAGKAYLTASTIAVMGHPVAAPQILMILAFSTAVSFIATIFSSILIVIKKQNAQIWPLVVITVINVALNLIFIPHYSYFASAVITLSTEAMVLIWWFFLSHKYLHFRLSYLIIAKAVLASLIMGAVLYLLDFMNIFALIAIGIAVYVLIGYLFKLFDKEMFARLLPGFLKGPSAE